MIDLKDFNLGAFRAPKTRSARLKRNCITSQSDDYPEKFTKPKYWTNAEWRKYNSKMMDTHLTEKMKRVLKEYAKNGKGYNVIELLTETSEKPYFDDKQYLQTLLNTEQKFNKSIKKVVVDESYIEKNKNPKFKTSYYFKR